VRWAYAGGIAALLVAAFLAGRVSRPAPPSATPAAVEADDVGGRVLVVAVVDHLDRSQMVLIELMNADLETGTPDIGLEQSRARELVAGSRLYRRSAVQAGDDNTGEVLDELERVLLEIANLPQGASKEDIEAMRTRIAARGLLFRVRVVHSEMRERERQTIAGSPS
jgi:hypothetical protein